MASTVGLGVVSSVGDGVFGTVAVGDGVDAAGGVAAGDEVVGADTGTVGAEVADLVGGAVGERVGSTVGLGAGCEHSPLSTQHNVQQGHSTSVQSALSSSRGKVRSQSSVGISPARSIRPSLTTFNDGTSPS